MLKHPPRVGKQLPVTGSTTNEMSPTSGQMYAHYACVLFHSGVAVEEGQCTAEKGEETGLSHAARESKRVLDPAAEDTVDGLLEYDGQEDFFGEEEEDLGTMDGAADEKGASEAQVLLHANCWLDCFEISYIFFC